MQMEIKKSKFMIFFKLVHPFKLFYWNFMTKSHLYTLFFPLSPQILIINSSPNRLQIFIKTTMNNNSNNENAAAPPVARRACAACKHQRRRCDETCVLAKYFPPERAEDFANVHRLFGVQNTIQILNSVDESEKKKTMESLIFEARIRKDFPVHGPLAVEAMFRAQIEKAEKELEMVNRQLQLFKGARKGKNVEASTSKARDDQGRT